MSEKELRQRLEVILMFAREFLNSYTEPDAAILDAATDYMEDIAEYADVSKPLKANPF